MALSEKGVGVAVVVGWVSPSEEVYGLGGPWSGVRG